MKLDRGTKLYRIDEELRFEEYTYIKYIERGEALPRHIVSTAGGFEKEIDNVTFRNQYCLSRIVALSEIEEKLRFKIEHIHDLMREHKMQFNPLVGADVIYRNNPFPNTGQFQSKAVYRYDKNGTYDKSFESVSYAAKYMSNETGLKKATYNTNIPRACKNNLVCSGYRWSYDKLRKLTP